MTPRFQRLEGLLSQHRNASNRVTPYGTSPFVRELASWPDPLPQGATGEDLDRVFLRSAERRSLVVMDAEGEPFVVNRSDFYLQYAGPLGFGRALLARRGIDLAQPGSPDLAAACGLFKDRAATLEELTDLTAMLWFEPDQVDPSLAEDLAAQMKPESLPALAGLADRLSACDWDKAGIAAAIKETLGAHGLKMPGLAVPVRLKVFGRAQTPSVDAMLALLPRETVLARLRR
jgi:hypothetical protein